MNKNHPPGNHLSAIVFAAILSLPLTVSHAETQHKGKARHAAQAPAKAAATAPVATGPLGVGSLKLGMTKTAVEALTSTDGVYLLEPLTVDPSGINPEGSVRYTARMMTPLDASGATKASLRFQDDKLAGFTIDLDEGPFVQALAQISSKYGDGKLSDDRKDEQCLYRNGANFKVNSGGVSHEWVQRISDTDQVRVSAVELTIDMCPPDLRGPRLGPQTSHFISFSDVRVDATPKPNPF